MCLALGWTLEVSLWPGAGVQLFQRFENLEGCVGLRRLVVGGVLMLFCAIVKIIGYYIR